MMLRRPAERCRPRGRIARALLTMMLVGGLLALLAYGLLSKSTNRSIDQALANHKTRPAPSFELPVLEAGSLPPNLRRSVGAALADGQLSLKELRGKAALINFWASWCLPCRLEASTLEQGWQRLSRRGIVFIGLDMQDLTGDARSFLRKYHITYPTIRDQASSVAGRYGAVGIPETYFISARGRVVAHVISAMSAQQLQSGAIAALSGRPGPSSQGAARDATP